MGPFELFSTNRGSDDPKGETLSDTEGDFGVLQASFFGGAPDPWTHFSPYASLNNKDLLARNRFTRAQVT